MRGHMPLSFEEQGEIVKRGGGEPFLHIQSGKTAAFFKVAVFYREKSVPRLLAIREDSSRIF